MTRPTQDTTGGRMISRTGLSPSVIPPFQTDSAIARLSNSLCSPTTPVRKSVWFGLFRFRSTLLTESIFLSVPLGTEMFQFSRLAACAYGFNARQFGNLRIISCLTDTRSLSQFSTPFKAFRRQDVPHALFFSYTRQSNIPFHRRRSLLFTCVNRRM